MGAWIMTYTGKRMYPLEPKVKDIHIIDIAHSLSLQCRFTGHTSSFYSVAEHSVRVSEACCAKNAYWGLLHDASEAYLSDMARPIKRYSGVFEVYIQAEKKLMEVIAKKFGLEGTCSPDVKIMDNVLLSTEGRDLMSSTEGWSELREPLKETIVPWDSITAERKFLEKFEELQ